MILIIKFFIFFNDDFIREKKKIQQPKVSTDEQLLHNIRQLNNLGIYRNLLFNQNIQQQNQRINRHFDKYQH